MKSYKLRVGDAIRIERFGYNHVGVYVGQRRGIEDAVVHNDKGIGVVLCTLSQFADGKVLHLHNASQGNEFEREQIAERALSLLGKKFDLITFNCEHLVNYAQNRNAESPQMQTAAGGVFIVGLLSLLFLGRRA